MLSVIWELCGSQTFFTAGSMTMVLPFISLYVDSMGNFSDSYVQSWSGWIFGITFVTAFIFFANLGTLW